MWEANEQNMNSVLTVYRSEWNCKERLYPNRITGRVSDSPEGKGKMSQTVLITGTGRPYALGFNLVRRYLENGDRVFASVRRPSEALEGLKKEFPDKLHILTMDIAATASVNAAARETEALTDHLDLIINNATTASADTMKELPDFDLDLIAPAVNVGAVGPIRVVKAFLPLLQKSPAGALVVNISSEAGSIGKCYRTFYLDYGTEKAALNMLTMTLHNYFKEDPNLNILCVHPGWMRTNPDNREAPLDPYEHAETLRCLFEKKRHDKDGPPDPGENGTASQAVCGSSGLFCHRASPLVSLRCCRGKGGVLLVSKRVLCYNYTVIGKPHSHDPVKIPEGKHENLFKEPGNKTIHACKAARVPVNVPFADGCSAAGGRHAGGDGREGRPRRMV